MTPTWSKNGVDLYLGDCREILPTLGNVDAVVTDPPYGIGFKYESHDDNPKGYGDFIWSVIQKCESLCNEGSPLFVFQAMLNIRSFTEWFPRDFRIFAAAKNFVQMRPTAMQFAYDPVVVWWTDGECFSLGTNSRDYHVGNTNPSTREDVDGHPCPRPLNQIIHIIEQWARPCGVILDPFMGSGTTGVACVRLGRKFIGIEVEPKYFEIAVRRIESAMDETSLLDYGKKQEQLTI